MIYSLFGQMYDYFIKHKFQSVIIVATMILAFGFHATQYTYHVDLLVDEYYNGTALISAGRFTAPIISFLTNWMTFAPFWHTVMMAMILFVAGLIFLLVMQSASGWNLQNGAVFTFWLIFSSFPIICYQLTFPILSVVLPYIFVGVAVWLTEPILEGQKNIYSRCILIVILLVVSVDMYESHAATFLTTFFAVIFLKYYYNEKSCLKNFRKIALAVVKVFSLLVIAIFVERILSKVVCYVCCGTFEFWYDNNTTVAWMGKSVLDVVKWLIRELVGKYVIAGASNYCVFMFDAALVGGIIITILMAVKKHTPWSVLLYLVVSISSQALAIVLGDAPHYRMAQPMSVFVAFFWLLFSNEFMKSKTRKMIILVIVGWLVLNQTLIINRYTVVDYQRHQYENNILINISEDLQEYSIEEKPVIFIREADITSMPDFSTTSLDFNNPIQKKYKSVMCNLFDNVIPGTVYRRLSARYSRDLSSAEKVADFYNKEYFIMAYHSFNTRQVSSKFTPEIYRAFSVLGYDLMIPREATADKEYQRMVKKYSDMPAYPSKGYILEEEDIIIVKCY